jgi:hypothetical protein
MSLGAWWGAGELVVARSDNHVEAPASHHRQKSRTGARRNTHRFSPSSWERNDRNHRNDRSDTYYHLCAATIFLVSMTRKMRLEFMTVIMLLFSWFAHIAAAGVPPPSSGGGGDCPDGGCGLNGSKLTGLAVDLPDEVHGITLASGDTVSLR